MKILKMYLKVKYCEVNKENNLHIAIGDYNPVILLKMGKNIQKNSSYRVSLFFVFKFNFGLPGGKQLKQNKKCFTFPDFNITKNEF
jgi:hypothetical protein